MTADWLEIHVLGSSPVLIKIPPRGFLAESSEGNEHHTALALALLRSGRGGIREILQSTLQHGAEQDLPNVTRGAYATFVIVADVTTDRLRAVERRVHTV